MASAQVTFIAGFGRFLDNLGTVLEHKDNVEAFLKDLGWPSTVSAASMSGLQTAFNISEAILQLRDLLHELEGEHPDESAIAHGLFNITRSLYETIRALATTSTAGQSYPFDQPDFWQQMEDELPAYLLEKFLVKEAPKLYGVLFLLGILDVKEVRPDSVIRWSYFKRSVHWDRLVTAIVDPPRLFREVYHWDDGANSFDYERFQKAQQLIFKFAGIIATPETPEHDLIHLYFDHTNPHYHKIQMLEIPIYFFATPDWEATAELGLGTMPITPVGNLDADPVGIVITPLLRGTLGTGISDPDNFISLAVEGTMEGDGLFRFEVRPDGVNFVIDPSQVNFDGKLGLLANPPTPWIIAGSSDGTRLEAGGFFTDFEVKGPLTDPEFIVRLGTSSRAGADQPNLAIVIDFGEGDGFIQKIVGGQAQRFELGGYLGWSSKHGVLFDGQAAFEIKLAPHINLGPLSIDAFYIGMKASDDALIAYVGLGLTLSLGPLVGVVENIGAQLKVRALEAGEAPGAFGDLNLELGFKPPNGVGLSVDAGVVKGGGYLFFDFDKGEYAGALELTFSEIISLKALGIITTKMPDGSDGFSLLIIITAEFGAGIQLGYGFVLIGVGGLLGLNRTMNLRALAEGVRTGGINGIMFPTNVVQNAPRILSDMRAFFPAEEGKFLIGPMAKLGWGSPVLITISLGVIIEIPGNIAIVGVLKIALPTEEATVLRLQVNFVGAIEFDKSRLWFFASIYDSRILFITLEGEMGLLVAWGDDANFVISVGGFHPSFNPPPLPFGGIVRLSLNILNESWGRIRVMAYFAVTSNTVQFGAHAELYFGFDAFKIDGHIGFDALFQFSPFYFIIELSASLSVKVFGIGLFSVRVRMSLEGPTPYRAKGTGSISLLFFDIDVDFDMTWGESRNTVLPPIVVMPLMKAEFEKLSNWRALLPTGNNILVSLRAIDAAAELVLHPVGTLQITQRFAPLELTLDKIGSQKPSDARKFKVAVDSGGGLSRKAEVDESFAMAQFQDMSNATKLSRPSFEKEKGGIELSVSGQQVTTGNAFKRIVRYELIVIDSNYKRFRRTYFNFPSGALFNHFLKGNAVAKSALSYETKKKYQPFEEKVKVMQGTYSVANVTDNKAFNTEAAIFSSQAQAMEYMQQQVSADPNLKESLHVVPQHELNMEA
jgi:hypothetical protein